MRALDDWGCPIYGDGEDKVDPDPVSEKAPAAPPRMYLIQYTRSFSGDSVIWWRANRSGYTFRLDEAGQYSEDEARSIGRVRGLDKAIPVEVAFSAASRHVVDADLTKVLAAHAAKVAP